VRHANRAALLDKKAVVVRFSSHSCTQKEINPEQVKLPCASDDFRRNKPLSALTAPIIILNFLKYFCSPMEFVQLFDMLKVTPVDVARIGAT
jgi:hypothetical protein